MSSQNTIVDNSTRGKLFVISAPSGAGKTSIVHAACGYDTSLKRAVTTTTRPMRDGEVDGRDYHFLTEADFHAKVEAGDFIEYANVFGNLYGLTRAAVETHLSQGQNVVVILDVQGALSVIKDMPDDVVSIFILPPSPYVLRRRLYGRGCPDNNLDARLNSIGWEVSLCCWFEYVVLNDDFEEAVADILAVVAREKPGDAHQAAAARGDNVLQEKHMLIKNVAAAFMT
mgnify:CR=1 FL=1